MIGAGVVPVVHGPGSKPSDTRPSRTDGSVLSGRDVLVTRPAEQSAVLAAAIEAAGGRARLLPTLEIAPIDDSAVLDEGLRRLGEYDLVVFVSANAVRAAQARCSRLGLPGMPAIRLAGAPGPATAAEIVVAGTREVIVPATRFDSEGLIEAMAARDLAPAQVLVLRGADDDASGTGAGRERLAHWLRERGAQVDFLACYRRAHVRADKARLAALAGAPAPDAIVVTSSEGGRSLVAMFAAGGIGWLASVPVFVPHPRIAEVMGQLGAVRVCVTAGGDAGLIRGLAEHFAPART